MSIALPIADDSAFRYVIPLDGTSYSLRFRWNDYDQSWYFNVYSADLTTPLVTGIRLVYGIDLLQQFQHKVKGTLFVRERSDSDGSRPLRADFGDLSGLVLEYTPP